MADYTKPKQIKDIICVYLALIAFSIALFPAPAQAGDQKMQSTISQQERAMKADQQQREYRHRMAAEAIQLKARGTSAQGPSVSLQIANTLKSSASTIFFKDDMEGGLNGWTTEVYSGPDLWHQTAINANSPTHSYWAGVEQQGTYNTGARVNTALKSPSISLLGASGPIELLFTESYFTEGGWDFCMVDVSTDAGTNWTHLRGGYGTAPSGDSYGWIITSLDLTAYAGQTITLRFYFDTGDPIFNDFAGWFIDNVVVFDQGGMITGKTFFDANHNGVKDSTDRGVKEWLVTAAGEGITITTKTDYRGKYWLPLPLGSYTITAEQRPGWTQTFPTPFPSRWDITMSTPDTLVDSVWFGNYTNASFVNGMFFNDVDHSGSYNTGDSLLVHWKVLLSDTLGNMVDFDWTDSLGVYQLFVFQPGHYIVSEVEKKGWVESFPPAESYTIDIPDLSTVVNGKDFGNYYSPLTNAIIGQKFNDRNRNHVFDMDEQGLYGFTIKLAYLGNNGKFHDFKTRTTDSSGYFQFMNLPPDTYKAYEVLGPKNVGWWQSYPDSSHYLILNLGQTLENVNFGNYEISPSTIMGMKYNDENGNGTKDGSETGLGGWTIQVNGTSVYNTSASQSVETDQTGNYVFNGLWPGTYVVSEVWRSGWRQTQPAELLPYILTLDMESALTSKDFGNKKDSTFNLAFRTFMPESLALSTDHFGKQKLVKFAPDKVDFLLTVTTLDSNTTGLHMEFTHTMLPNYPFGTVPPSTITQEETKGHKWSFTFNSPLDSGVTVQVYGFGSIGKVQKIPKWWWMRSARRLGPKLKDVNWVRNMPKFPMPNLINALAAGAGTNLKVGLGGAHTVKHPTYKEVLKSLKDIHGMHIGTPRCLGLYSKPTGKSIKSQLKFLTPTQGQNRLFAEGIAFQANLKASNLGIVPPGLGGLIFNDGSDNLLNGLSLMQIAAKMDTTMSSFNETDKTCGNQPSFYDNLYQTIRMIDSAFSGPLDTVKWAGGLVFKPVRALSAVPFLRLDSSFAQMGTAPILSSSAVEVPQQFTLEQNYPNPFNPSTVIEFYLTLPSIVSLKVYNTLGQEVVTLIDGQEMADGWARYELSSNGLHLASGVYYYRLVAETLVDEDNPLSQKFSMVKKMVLLK